MSQNIKTRVELDIILKRKPGFIVRWGLIVFVMIVVLILLLVYYSGYDIFNFRKGTPY